MLSKKQFLARLNFLMEHDKRVSKFDEALKEFAPSDFTGFYDEKIHCHLLDSLVEDMNDDTDVISWWLYDCPEAGRNPEHCKIWLGDSDDKDTEVVELKTPEDVYDYLFICNAKAPSKDTMNMVLKSQDTGVKFALKILSEMLTTNTKVKNKNWEERNALLTYAISKIGHEYLFQAGINRDIDYHKPVRIITCLEEEECES